MTDQPTQDQHKPQGWRPGKRDVIFAAIVAAVILALVLGTSERTTKATPNDATHQQATSRDACMSCHDASGVHPQPMGPPRADQCFQCHMQPKDWQGSMR